MKIALAPTLGAFLASRAVVLLLIAAFLAVTLIGVTGMRALVLVSETVRGGGSAIDAATELRGLAHRIHRFVVTEALGRRIDRPEIADTVARFDDALKHPALIGAFERHHDGNEAAGWRERLEPRLLELAETPDQDLALPARAKALLHDLDGLVAQIDAVLAALEDEAQSRVARLRTILAVGLTLAVAVVLAAVPVMRRRVFQPLALGVSRQIERERLIALQEERSIIARELHDSIAQSLSYMKIQVSLLQPVISDPNRDVEAGEILEDLRDGINAAYRQLRELLSSFRLKMEGDFSRLLLATAEEFSTRGGIPVDVQMRLAACSLNANQEIHVLQIIREALSNATRHSGATAIEIGLACSETGEVSVVIDDDGSGIDFAAVDVRRHYGVAIMSERARGLGGEFAIGPRPGGGTRVSVRFDPRGSSTADPRNAAARAP